MPNASLHCKTAWKHAGYSLKSFVGFEMWNVVSEYYAMRSMKYHVSNPTNFSGINILAVYSELVFCVPPFFDLRTGQTQNTYITRAREYPPGLEL